MEWTGQNLTDGFYRIGGETSGKRDQLKYPDEYWEDLQRTGWGAWTDLAQDTDNWWALGKTVMTYYVRKKDSAPWS